jgi:hypothetical protein
MKSKVLLFLCVILIIDIYSCTYSGTKISERQITNDRIIPRIDIAKAINNEFVSLKLSNIVEEIEYIRPEYPATVLGTVFDYQIDNNHLYIQVDQRLLCYTRQGKFLREISRYGQGPAEHLGIRSFSIQDSIIAINSNYGRKIQLYNIQGEYKGKVLDVSDAVFKINLLDSNRYAIHLQHGVTMNDPALFITGIIDAKGDTVQLKKTKPDYSQGLAVAPSLWYYRDLICVKTCVNDTVYAVTKDSVTPRYVLDYGKYKISRDAFADIRLHENERYKYIEGESFCETDKYLLVMFQLHNKRYIVCYFKESTEIYSWSQNNVTVNRYNMVIGGGIENDLDGSGKMSYFKSVNNSYLGGIIFPEELTVNYKESLNSVRKVDVEKQKVLERIVNSLHEDENPIVVLYKLRQ